MTALASLSLTALLAAGGALDGHVAQQSLLAAVVSLAVVVRVTQRAIGRDARRQRHHAVLRPQLHASIATAVAGLGHRGSGEGRTDNFTGAKRREPSDGNNVWMGERGVGRPYPPVSLASRQAFYEGLRRALTDRQPTDVLAVLVIDIDRFKEINDSAPDVSGDELLSRIADRMAGRLEAGETLAHLGGDEFGLVLAGDELRAHERARGLKKELEAPVTVSGRSIRVEASVGIALWPTHGAVGDRLLARADIAMYRAKSARSGVEVFRFQGHDPGWARRW